MCGQLSLLSGFESDMYFTINEFKDRRVCVKFGTDQVDKNHYLSVDT